MNILIVKLSAIGDVIHTLPALNAVRKQYPDAHITWLVEEAAVDRHRAETKCSPCFKRQCKTIDCMKEIPVERVLNGVEQLRI